MVLLPSLSTVSCLGTKRRLLKGISRREAALSSLKIDQEEVRRRRLRRRERERERDPAETRD